MSWKDAANSAGSAEAAGTQRSGADEHVQGDLYRPNVPVADFIEQTGLIPAAPSVLDGWKASVGMFVFGLACSLALAYAVSFAGNYLGVGLGAFWVPLVFGAVYLAFAIAYALAIYPSLFGDRPKLKSNAAISFFNAFAGGLIIGGLWCACLKRKRIGISHYVLVALLALEIVASLVVGFAGSGAFSGMFASQSASTASLSSSSNAGIPDSVKQKYVGTWELTEYTDEKHTVDAARLEELHQAGRESFLNITSGKGVIFNYLGAYEFGIWDATSESDVSISIMGEGVSNLDCDGQTLSFEWKGGKYAFAKGEPRDAPNLFEYQEWTEPFIGTWNAISIEQDGALHDAGNRELILQLELNQKATLTLNGESNSCLWMASSATTGTIFLGEAQSLSIVDSELIWDWGNGRLIHFQKA